MIAPRHLIFTAVEGVLVDARTGSFSETEEVLSELEHRNISVIWVTPQTRAEIEPLRRKVGHNHPFVTESGGGIFVPDGYFNIRIPGVVRIGRYLAIAQGLPYEEVCTALDEIAEECGVGVAGFHHMKLREVSDNTGLSQREAELARTREFDEPFYFTTSDANAVARFVATSEERGFQARPGKTFWHFSSGCDAARAVRTLTRLVREATHLKLSSVGIGTTAEDLTWLQAVDHAVLLPSGDEVVEQPKTGHSKTVVTAEIPGPAGWSAAILDIIS